MFAKYGISTTFLDLISFVLPAILSNMIYNSTENDGLDWCKLAHSLLISYKNLEKRNELNQKVKKKEKKRKGLYIYIKKHICFMIRCILLIMLLKNKIKNRTNYILN